MEKILKRRIKELREGREANLADFEAQLEKVVALVGKIREELRHERIVPVRMRQKINSFYKEVGTLEAIAISTDALTAKEFEVIDILEELRREE